MAGRPRKRTAEEALAQGDPGKRGKKKLKQQARSDATANGANEIDVMRPVKPDWLTPEASEVWDRKLVQSPHLRAVDSEMFADWCQNQAEFERCQEIIRDQGFFKKNSNRTQSKREEVSLLKELRKELLKLAEQLGFTPRARKTLGINVKAQPKPDDRATGATITRPQGPSGNVAFMVPARPRS